MARTDARPWRMVDIPMIDPESGQPITLKATYYPPAVAGRAPLLLMNHGDVTPGYEQLVLRYGELARLFVSRGWAVLEIMRRGAGGSGGTLLPELRSDSPPTVAYGDRRMAADIADVDAVLADVRTWPNIDPTHILLGGFSRGGMVALEYLAARPDAAIGALNFSGSVWAESVERDAVQGRYTGDRLARAGASIRKPTLWLYADNDPYQSEAIIRRRFDGYRAAGGTGDLRIYSGIPRDGHDLVNRPAFWEAAVLDFLRRLSP
jgi:pimeloyl-ACP methyl ester carboxylesterase